MGNSRFILSLLVLLLLVLVTCLFGVALGAVVVPPARVLHILTAPSDTAISTTDRAIVHGLRLPRVILAALIGAGLAVAGAAFQSLFRNPLADPFVIGASGGASLGATLAIVTGLSWRFAGFGPVPMAAFVGALLAVLVVYSIAEAGGQAPALSLLLAGAAMSTLLSALVSLFMLLSQETLHEVFNWVMGSLSGRSWPHLWASGPYLLFGLGALWLVARPLDALSCGDDTARSLGLSLTQMRGVVVGAASLTTAAAVAAGGVIGFVGLIAPHIARLLFGASHHRLVPASALLGALLLVVADVVARTVVAPVELPLGVVTALVGGLFFLYLLKARQKDM